MLGMTFASGFEILTFLIPKEWLLEEQIPLRVA